MTSNVTFEPGTVDMLPCMMMNRKTKTVILADSTDVKGDWVGTCLSDPTDECYIGQIASWGFEDFAIFRGQVTLRG